MLSTSIAIQTSSLTEISHILAQSSSPLNMLRKKPRYNVIGHCTHKVYKQFFRSSDRKTFHKMNIRLEDETFASIEVELWGSHIADSLVHWIRPGVILYLSNLMQKPITEFDQSLCFVQADRNEDGIIELFTFDDTATPPRLYLGSMQLESAHNIHKSYCSIMHSISREPTTEWRSSMSQLKQHSGYFAFSFSDCLRCSRDGYLSSFLHLSLESASPGGAGSNALVSLSARSGLSSENRAVLASLNVVASDCPRGDISSSRAKVIFSTPAHKDKFIRSFLSFLSASNNGPNGGGYLAEDASHDNTFMRLLTKVQSFRLHKTIQDTAVVELFFDGNTTIDFLPSDYFSSSQDELPLPSVPEFLPFAKLKAHASKHDNAASDRDSGSISPRLIRTQCSLVDVLFSSELVQVDRCGHKKISVIYSPALLIFDAPQLRCVDKLPLRNDSLDHALDVGMSLKIHEATNRDAAPAPAPSDRMRVLVNDHVLQKLFLNIPAALYLAAKQYPSIIPHPHRLKPHSNQYYDLSYLPAIVERLTGGLQTSALQRAVFDVTLLVDASGDSGDVGFDAVMVSMDSSR